jgi:hypothetical protein
LLSVSCAVVRYQLSVGVGLCVTLMFFFPVVDVHARAQTTDNG